MSIAWTGHTLQTETHSSVTDTLCQPLTKLLESITIYLETHVLIT